MPKWKQFSGNWTLTQQAQAKGAGTWPGIPGAPTIGTATAGNAQASVAFTAPADTGYPTTLSYTATSSPGGLTGTGSASPITVTGLTNETSYTFTVTATNDTGTGPASAASNSVTPTLQGELYTWGFNNKGNLGTNTPTFAPASSPTQVGALSTWLKIDGGKYHFASLKSDGTLWAWGEGATNGQIGDNTAVNKSSPVQVGAETDWYSASAGGRHTAAIKTDGSLWTWGSGGNGALGHNNATYISSPIQVGSLTTWLQVAAGGYHTAAIKTDGTLWIWGNNSQGQLGLNLAYTKISSPVQVGALSTWGNVNGTRNATYAVKTDGTLWAWGQNSQGQLGINNIINRSSPVQVGALTNWARAGMGDSRLMCVALKTNGTIWTWGQNTSGDLGQNNIINRSSPVQVGSSTWLEISSGEQVVAVRSDGTLWAWGRANQGQVGNLSTINRSSPVQLGAETSWFTASAQSFTSAAISG